MREVCESTQDMTCTHTQTRPIHDELQLDLRRRTIAVIGGLDGFWGQVPERECKPQFIITCPGQDQYPITMLNLGDEHL